MKAIKTTIAIAAVVSLSACQSATFSKQLSGTNIPAGLEHNSAVKKACDNTTQTAGLLLGAVLGAGLAVATGNEDALAAGAILGAGTGAIVAGKLNKQECDLAIATAKRAMASPGTIHTWRSNDGNYGSSVIELDSTGSTGYRIDVVWANGQESQSRTRVSRSSNGRWRAL